MSEQSPDEPKPQRVDPDDIRRALEEHARRRPPRPPSAELPPEPKLPKIPKPIGRRRRKP